MRFNRKSGILLVAAGLLGLSAMHASAETTVADYYRLTKPDRADLVGRVLQTFVDNLQKEDHVADAQCLADLYTTPPAGSKKGLSVGMMEFFDLVQLARETDPAKYTIERIIVGQAKEHCGKKAAPR